jgi:DNA topoisomerase-3
MIITKWGYGCSAWRDGCKFSVGTICQKRITENQARMLITKGKSPLIKGFLSKSGKTFDAYLVLDGGSIKFEFPSK